MSGSSFPNIAQPWRKTQRGDYATPYSGPENYYTNYSSTVDGRTTIDPTIRTNQDAARASLSGGLSDYETNTDQLRSRLQGNESDYMNAVLNPLRQQVAQRGGQLQRSLGLRGVAGSSFGDQAQTNFSTDSGRALRDATAQAEQEQISGLSGLDQAKLNAQLGTNQQQEQISRDQLQQELAGLGLSQGQIQQQMQQYDQDQTRGLQNLALQNQLLNTFHSLVTDWGDFKGIGGGGKAPSG